MILLVLYHFISETSIYTSSLYYAPVPTLGEPVPTLGEPVPPLGEPIPGLGEPESPKELDMELRVLELDLELREPELGLRGSELDKLFCLSFRALLVLLPLLLDLRSELSCLLRPELPCLLFFLISPSGLLCAFASVPVSGVAPVGGAAPRSPPGGTEAALCGSGVSGRPLLCRPPSSTSSLKRSSELS
jgi:hypothetical protein